MKPTLRPEVQELLRVCEKLERQDSVLTVQECEVVYRCAKELEKKALPDRSLSERTSSSVRRLSKHTLIDPRPKSSTDGS